ncbi:MAG: aldehyde dehydrogenase (NADP(+)) [Tepidisphaeraceae bacterium]
MPLTGRNFIGSTRSSRGAKVFRAVNPSLNKEIEPAFHEAVPDEIDRAMKLSEAAFVEYRGRLPGQRAAFLRGIASEIERLGDELVERAVSETALPAARITGERGRTNGQLRMFADLVEEGSWVDARIDHGDANRKPAPKPDIRRALTAIGPVVVFGASNFPLAFSVVGGDTASALAAGCSVVIKAHPSHPGTSELVMGAMLQAAKSNSMPDGVVSLLHGVDPEVSLALVSHALAKAVGFTGSHRAGRALFDLAAARAEPIPVYAEMGSINPVFVLPRAVKESGVQIAEGLTNSVTLGVGQFCTKPGVVVCLDDEATRRFVEEVLRRMAAVPVGTMLNPRIAKAYADGRKQFGGVHAASPGLPTQAVPTVFTATGEQFLSNRHLREELFGPETVVVTAKSPGQFEEIASCLDGQLTATIHAAGGELAEYRLLVEILRRKAGRLIFNGYPTGVEVCSAMHHGGPYPATTDSRSTSVGTAAIERFARPVCYQDCPAEMLPAELLEGNPMSIWRLIDGQWSQ